jgi:hypothetical protein
MLKCSAHRLAFRRVGLAVLLLIATLVLPASLAASEPWRQRHIWITFWSAPPATDAILSKVAAENFNLTWGDERALDVAAKHGLKLILQSPLLKPEALTEPAKKKELDQLIALVKTHPALEAYFLADEPLSKDFAGLGALVAYLKEHDPAHVAYINLLPSYAGDKLRIAWLQRAMKLNQQTDPYRSYVRDFVNVVKPQILSYDHYHFYRSSDPDEYFFNMEVIRESALRAGIPFVNVIQAARWTPRWRMPNGNELRWMVYTTLAYGGRGISYFLYWGPKAYGGLYQDGKPSPVVADVSKLNGEIAKLSAALLKLKSVGVAHTGGLPIGTKALPKSWPVQIANGGNYVVGLFASKQNADAFMIVNRDYRKAVSAKAHIKAKRIQEFDRITGKRGAGTEVAANKIVDVVLAPGDGRLFRFSQ